MKIIQYQQEVVFTMSSLFFLTCCADGFHMFSQMSAMFARRHRSWKSDSPTLRRSQTKTNRKPVFFPMVDDWWCHHVGFSGGVPKWYNTAILPQENDQPPCFVFDYWGRPPTTLGYSEPVVSQQEAVPCIFPKPNLRLAHVPRFSGIFWLKCGVSPPLLCYTLW